MTESTPTASSDSPEKRKQRRKTAASAFVAALLVLGLLSAVLNLQWLVSGAIALFLFIFGLAYTVNEKYARLILKGFLWLVVFPAGVVGFIVANAWWGNGALWVLNAFVIVAYLAAAIISEPKLGMALLVLVVMSMVLFDTAALFVPGTSVNLALAHQQEVFDGFKETVINKYTSFQDETVERGRVQFARSTGTYYETQSTGAQGKFGVRVESWQAPDILPNRSLRLAGSLTGNASEAALRVAFACKIRGQDLAPTEYIPSEPGRTAIPRLITFETGKSRTDSVVCIYHDLDLLPKAYSAILEVFYDFSTSGVMIGQFADAATSDLSTGPQFGSLPGQGPVTVGMQFETRMEPEFISRTDAVKRFGVGMTIDRHRGSWASKGTLRDVKGLYVLVPPQVEVVRASLPLEGEISFSETSCNALPDIHRLGCQDKPNEFSYYEIDLASIDQESLSQFPFTVTMDMQVQRGNYDALLGGTTEKDRAFVGLLDYSFVTNSTDAFSVRKPRRVTSNGE